VSTHDLSWLTPDIEQAQAHHQARVAALYAGRPVPGGGIVRIAGPAFGVAHGLAGKNDPDMLRDPDAWIADVLADMAARRDLLADRDVYRPAAIHLDPLGVHFVDAIFGAKVYIHGPQVWSDELQGEVGDLQPPDIASSPAFQQTTMLAQKAVEASQARLLVGAPVLSCAINTAINLYGERFLTALVDRPEDARRAVRIITDAMLFLTRAFARLIPDAVRRTSAPENRYAPPGHGLIDGCATQLVSARQYREFFLDAEAEALGAYPCGGMMHLCGTHRQHIPFWREMQALRAVQLNDRATDDLPHYVDGLRTDQIFYVAPTEKFTAERICDLVPAHRLVLQA
jgi:hypothetical protein